MGRPDLLTWAVLIDPCYNQLIWLVMQFWGHSILGWNFIPSIVNCYSEYMKPPVDIVFLQGTFALNNPRGLIYR